MINRSLLAKIIKDEAYKYYQPESHCCSLKAVFYRNIYSKYPMGLGTFYNLIKTAKNIEIGEDEYINCSSCKFSEKAQVSETCYCTNLFKEDKIGNYCKAYQYRIKK
jgi:hypothetical protein